MVVDLNRIYEQRIGLAVAAAKQGHRVKFRVIGHGDPAYLVWFEGVNRRHVVARGSTRAMEALLVRAQAEFDRQTNLHSSLKRKESGVPEE